MFRCGLLRIIRWYQAKGGSRRLLNTECNFIPSCSEYTYQAIEKYGVWQGVRMGLQRIRRCNNPDCDNKAYDPLH